jgi:hypothetical protein
VVGPLARDPGAGLGVFVDLVGDVVFGEGGVVLVSTQSTPTAK